MDRIPLAPWDTPNARQWLGTLESWPKLLRLVCKTLEQEPRKYPHEIRAAAAVVIMIGREGLWPNTMEVPEIQGVVSLAKRQLSQVKQLFSSQGRIDPRLVKDRSYRTLLNSLDDELRLLESRLSDEEFDLPDDPPVSWGNFWTDEAPKTKS